MKKIKVAMKIMVVFVLMCSMLMGSNAAQMAVQSASSTWSVYYAYGGGNGENYIAVLSTYYGFYRAQCDSIGGNCTYRAVSITAYHTNNNGVDDTPKYTVKLTKNLLFSAPGKIDFELDPVPQVRNIFFPIHLSHSNGTSANASGTIKII